MTKTQPDPELRHYLASFHGTRSRIFLTNGQDTTGIVNTTTWDNGRPSAIYLVATEDPELAAVLVPWHSVAAIGKILDHDRPRNTSGEVPTTTSGPVPILDPDGALTSEEADRLLDALRADNEPAGPISGGFRP